MSPTDAPGAHSDHPGGDATHAIDNHAVRLSEAQRWALLAADDHRDTDWVRSNTIDSLIRRGLIHWVDNRNAYANGRGGYTTTAAGRAAVDGLQTEPTAVVSAAELDDLDGAGRTLPAGPRRPMVIGNGLRELVTAPFGQLVSSTGSRIGYPGNSHDKTRYAQLTSTQQKRANYYANWLYDRNLALPPGQRRTVARCWREALDQIASDTPHD